MRCPNGNGLDPEIRATQSMHDPMPENIFPRRGGNSLPEPSKEGGGLNDWND